MTDPMTYEEAAQYLRITKGTLQQWVHQKRVPHQKRGGAVRFFREQLEEWLLESSVKVSKHWR